MENGLKVGHRLTVFVLIKDIPHYGLRAGRQFLGLEPFPYLLNPNYHPTEEGFYIYPLKGEVKPVGRFIVREIKTNNDPCTII